MRESDALTRTTIVVGDARLRPALKMTPAKIAPWMQGVDVVRGDLLLKPGRRAEAKAELEKAARMATNARERDLLLARAASCVSAESGPAN